MTQGTSEPWIFLLGRPPRDEYLGFLTHAAAGQPVSIGAAAQRWRAAAEILDQRAVIEAGAADDAASTALPDKLTPSATKWLSDPVITEAYAVVPPTIEMVPLDKLVVFQRAINLAYAQKLGATIGSWAHDDDALLDFCLATKQTQPDISALQTAGNGFVFASPSTDARFLGAELLPASQVMGRPMGRAQHVVVLYVGYGANALNVLSANGRLILNNGSHRAYALKAAGFTHVPAVVQKLTRQDDLSICQPVQQAPDLYLGAARPPMLGDYFDAVLHEEIAVPRKVRQIRTQFGVEQSDAPG